MTFAGGDTKQRSDESENTVAEEFASIEARLENLRALIATSAHAIEKTNNTGITLSSSGFAKLLIADRSARNAEFPTALFADPAWDILLDLFVANADQLRISVTSAVIAANVPPTTALRWISVMTDQGYLVRAPDPHDRRRVYVDLAQDTVERIQNYLENISTKWGVTLTAQKTPDREAAT